MGILCRIDENSGTPIFRQIVDQIIELVHGDVIKPGTRLPSTRSMADRLAVSRTTVCKAYDELWSLGYVESRSGSYTTIRNRTKVVSGRAPAAGGLIDWTERTTAAVGILHTLYLDNEAFAKDAEKPGIINFGPLSPDSRLLPVDAFRKCMNEVLADEGADLLQYGSALGYGPLREFIAERMGEHSVAVSADDIIITNGSTQALELLVRLLAAPHRAVVVERPTYSGFLNMLRSNDIRTIEVPMTPKGMDLAARGCPGSGVTGHDLHYARLPQPHRRHYRPGTSGKTACPL